MKPSQCLPGVFVSYEPSPGHLFVGMVATFPWQIGRGTWVTKLADMEWQYGEFTGKKGEKRFTVFAAALDSCVPVNQPALIRYRPNGSADRDEYVSRYRNDSRFKYLVDSIWHHVLDAEMSTDCYRLAVECAVELLKDHFIECSTLRPTEEDQ